MLAGLVVFLVLFMLWWFAHFAKVNPDSLRSERFTLSKMAIDKGLVGDDSAGLFEPANDDEIDATADLIEESETPPARQQEAGAAVRTRLIIAVDGATATQRGRITAGLKGSGVNWWHWFQTVWLVVDPEGRPASFWRDHVKSWVPVCDALVIEIRGPAAWAAINRRQRYTGVKGPFDWLKKVQWTNAKGPDDDPDDEIPF